LLPFAAHAQQQTITVAKGDTLALKFTITTDTLLRAIGGTKILASKCSGLGHIFFRVWKGVQILQADTVNVFVPCAGQASAASIGICFLRPSLADSLHIRGDTSINPINLPPGTCKSADTLTIQPPL
jgi:hypothetical protein